LFVIVLEMQKGFHLVDEFPDVY